MMRNGRHLFTSESVTEGHPDKIADQISDAVLDAVLAQDPVGRVACETLVTTGLASSPARSRRAATWTSRRSCARRSRTSATRAPSSASTARPAPCCPRSTSSRPTSPWASTPGGAGDQGLMFGYACDETEELMPLPIMLAHKLDAPAVRARGATAMLDFLRPDGKSQVTVEYDGDKPVRVDAVVVSTQHSATRQARDRCARTSSSTIIEPRPARPSMLDAKTQVSTSIPPAGSSSAGRRATPALTGRKIIVDTYGGVGRHGGGAFSGKDPTKVDRSASLHGALHRQEHRGRRAGRRAARCSSPTPSAWPSRCRSGRHVRHRASSRRSSSRSSCASTSR